MESPSLSNGTRIRLQVVIASESTDGQVRDLRKFLHITQKENDISSLITEVNAKFKCLYPSERYVPPYSWLSLAGLFCSCLFVAGCFVDVAYSRPITILRIQDGDGCDLDTGYQVYDVFGERSVLKVIISDDGPDYKRVFSPAGSKLAILQNRLRRESFDSVSGYATPSISDLPASPTISQLKQGSDGPVTNGVLRSDGGFGGRADGDGGLTREALDRMQVDHTRSPELGDELERVQSTSSMGRKRKRSVEMEIPASPEKKRKDVGGTNGTEKEIPESQPTVQPEPKKPKKPGRKPSVNAAKGKQNPNALPATQVPDEHERTAMDQPPPSKQPSVVIKKTVISNTAAQNTNRQTTPELAIIKETPRNTPKPKHNPRPDILNSSPVVNTPARVSQSPLGIKAKIRRNAKSPSPASSATSGPTSSDSDNSEIESSRTSRSQSSDSDSGSNSDSEPSSQAAGSVIGEKMDVDEIKKSPGVDKRRLLSPKKGIGEAVGKDVQRSVSRSASPSSSSSSSDSDSDSDSDSVKDAGSDAETSKPKATRSVSDTNSNSNSDSSSDSDSDSDSDSSSSSSSGEHSPTSRSLSPPARLPSHSPAASSTKSKSSHKSSNSSTSSSARAVAVSLGGSTSRNPILHRACLSQEADLSPRDLSLSQQSPLATAGGGNATGGGNGRSLLTRWKSLSDLRGGFMAQPKAQKVVVPVQKSESEESEDSSSDESSDSSESDSDEDEKGGIPKSKLAGRVKAKKRKSESFRRMFRDD